MKKRVGLTIALTVISSLAVGFVNIHASEVQAPVLTILVLTFLLGCLDPRRAWLWAISLGGAVPLSYALAPIFGHLVPYPPDPNIFASFIALIPAYTGAYAGVLARRVAFSASDHPTMK